MTVKSVKRSPKRKGTVRAVRAASGGGSGGSRVGTKRLDRRWKDQAGNLWASKFESDVYEWLRNRGATVRACTRGRDSVAYTTPVMGGTCSSCGHAKVHQSHTYTPDLLADSAWPNQTGGIPWEIKGYLRPKDRRILRAVHKSGTIPCLALLLQRHHAATVAWAIKYLRGWYIGTWSAKTGITVIQ